MFYQQLLDEEPKCKGAFSPAFILSGARLISLNFISLADFERLKNIYRVALVRYFRVADPILALIRRHTEFLMSFESSSLATVIHP